MKYQFVNEKQEIITWDKRILLYIVQKDHSRGRKPDVEGWYNDLKASIFMFSSGYVHLSDGIFINVVYWNELTEYGKPDYFGEGEITLPLGHTGLSFASSGKRRSFNLALRKLIRNKLLWGFTNSFRSIQGLGGKKVPLLQIWSEQNRNMPKDIFAVSLTEDGFNYASDLLSQQNQICPWQLHEEIVSNEDFAASITGHIRNEVKKKT